jgi:hypothetical protein
MWQSGHSSVGACPYLKAILPLYTWPYTNLSKVVPSVEKVFSLLCIALPTCCSRAPLSLFATRSRRYREVWWSSRSIACLTLARSCWDGLVKACIWRRSSSGMVHHALVGVGRTCWFPRLSAGAGGWGVYITQCCGRGALSPMSTRMHWCGGRFSKLVTASLAAASARSLPRMLVWALILCRAVWCPASFLVSRRSVMLSRRIEWWW